MERKTIEANLQPLELSLPIYDKLSVKEKLKEERNKEYNIFLQNKAQTRGTAPTPVGASDAPAASSSLPNSYADLSPSYRKQPERKDASTLTEEVESRKSTRTCDSGHRGRRRLQVHSPKEHCSSEEELMKDKDEELEFRRRRRKDRHPTESDYNGERRTREHKNNSLQMPGTMRGTTRSRPATSKEKHEFATGLLIGTIEDPTASQMRKEIYKQELLKQIAEQQKNKMKEKKLELRVAATGATDAKKRPDRIKQFRPVNQQQDSWKQDVSYESGVDVKARRKDPDQKPNDNKPPEHTGQGGLQGRMQADCSTAVSQLTRKTAPGSVTAAEQGVSSMDYFTEEYHREFSNMLGEMAAPRVTSVPPPLPPAIPDNYKTPYDALYYYYGTRNLLDPTHPHNQNVLATGAPQSGMFHSPPQRPSPLRPSDLAEATGQRGVYSLNVGKVLADESKQRIENVLSYQEALREQIKEREESKRREKEEKKHYDAKIEAEMIAYNPWGKSGGGAPIKDQKGNLFSDFNQMHKINEESYKNPVVKISEVTTARPHRLSGFNDQPIPQQLDARERYKEELRRQIEENKRKQAEEREKMRTEEEKEEKRLAEQRARIQREYEEDQRKQKKTEHRLEEQSWIHEPKTPHLKEEHPTKQEQGIPGMEDKTFQLSHKREPSPPIPTLHEKRTDAVATERSSAASRLSARTVDRSEQSASARQHQPAPEKIAPLQDGHQEVIRELSALRRYLWKEKSQLEGKLGKIDQHETHFTPPNRHRGRPRVNPSESLHKPNDQPSAVRLHSGTARVNMENIREFNQLKYRDTASREEVRHLYPDPPTDTQSLDIQQQVLLGEQRRKIRRMKREEGHDLSALQPDFARNKPGRFFHRDPLLPSETTFMDVYGSEANKEQVHQQGPRQPSAERQEEKATWRTHACGEEAASRSQRDRQMQPESQWLTGLNGEANVQGYNQQRRQQSHTNLANGKPEMLSGDEVDTVSLRSALERAISIETIATEPWLRPGTSDDVKRSGSRLRPNCRMDAPPWLGIT